jgi:hypothetical protein
MLTMGQRSRGAMNEEIAMMPYLQHPWSVGSHAAATPCLRVVKRLSALAEQPP